MTQPSNPFSRRLAVTLFGAVVLAAAGCTPAGSQATPTARESTATAETTANATANATSEATAEATTESTPEVAMDLLSERTPDIAVILTRLDGDVERGEALFLHGREPAPACQNCHAHTAAATFSLGPSLVGVGERAQTRIPGMDADEYITRSILHPREFTVAGYRDIMYPNYASYLSEQDLADLVAFLKQL